MDGRTLAFLELLSEPKILSQAMIFGKYAHTYFDMDPLQTPPPQSLTFVKLFLVFIFEGFPK